jgi:ribonuclease P protein component
MGRRGRLSRSRDFDAVYRHGRSVSTRYLVLYAFPRPEEQEADTELRLGLAVSRKVGGAVERNRIKRRLRDAFGQVSADLAPGHDYVLVVRPGLAEAAEARGFEWLLEQVREVAGLAGGGDRARAG